MENSNYSRNYNYGGMTSSVSAQNSLMRNVYVWMTGALIVTALAAYYVATSFELQQLIFGNQIMFWGLIIAEFGIVIALNAAINHISAFTATLLFLLYSAINGATLSSIFLIYSITSIGTTFLITAGTFGAMAIYGTVTKTDLTKIGNLLIMAVIGLIIASIVNIFWGNSTFDLIISGVGVLIFVGLTAYDAQKIKQMLYAAEDNEVTQKIAVLGALSLYLDFVNLFLYLLRFFGRRD